MTTITIKPRNLRLFLSSMPRTYLGHLYHHHRRLFWLGCIIFFAWLVPSIIGWEITPFYDYRMYASPTKPSKEYPVYILRYNGKEYNEPHTWQDHKRMMLQYTLPHYVEIKETGDTIPFHTKTERFLLPLFRWNPKDNHLNMTTADLAAYPQWVKRYLQQQTGEAINSLILERVWVTYDSSYHVMPLHRDTIFHL